MPFIQCDSSKPDLATAKARPRQKMTEITHKASAPLTATSTSSCANTQAAISARLARSIGD